MEWSEESEFMKDLDSLSHMTRETPRNKIRNWTLEEPQPMFESGYEDEGDMDMSASDYGPSWFKPFTGSGRGALHLKTYEQINMQAQIDRDIQAQVRLATPHNYSNETIEQSFRAATVETECMPGTLDSPLPGQFDDDAAEASIVESPSTGSPPAVSSSVGSPPVVSSSAGRAGVGRNATKPKLLSLYTILKMNSIVTNAVNANEKGRKVKQAAIEDCKDNKLSEKPNGTWCKPQAPEKDSAQESSWNLSKSVPSLKTTPLLKTPPTAPSMKTTPPELHTAQDLKFLDSLKPAPPVYALEDQNQFPGLGGASRRK